jgi:3-hydroxyisobutyrate dehydrogenase-like beta-hydroxyacid dehydrogenase
MKEGRYDHGFAVDLMRKDLNIVLDQAKLMEIDLAITDLVDSFYEEIQKMDGGSWDTSSLLKRLES